LEPIGVGGKCILSALKICFDDRPHPDLLPRGEGTTFGHFLFHTGLSANPAVGISKDAGTTLLLLGEKAGMREDVNPFNSSVTVPEFGQT
jgi:hypothetical protein